MTSLWGDLGGLPVIRTPKSILTEQGPPLFQATGGVLHAEVVQIKDQLPDFCYKFYIKVPELNNYRYQVLVVRHSIDIYPVDVSTTTGVWESFHTPADFEAYLSSILSSPHMKSIISKLVSQARS